MKDKNRTPSIKPLARERIVVLFSEAEKVFHEHPEYSDRYVALARKIAMRQRVRIDLEYRRRFCHHCYRYLVPGQTCGCGFTMDGWQSRASNAKKQPGTGWRDLMTTKTDPSMQDLKPTVWIGKQGCTEATIEEIVAQLKKRKVIKVKWLQNTEVDPEAVAEAARAVLVSVRGKTMVLAERGKKEKR